AVSRVQIGRRSGHPNIQIASPVRSEDGGMKAYVSASLPLEPFQTMCVDTVLHTPDSRAIILDGDGTIVADTAISMRSVRTLERLALFDLAPDKRISIREGLDEFGHQSRAAVVRASGTLQEHPWTVVVLQSTSAIRAEADAARTRALYASGLV